MSRGRGFANGNETTYDNTAITATNQLTVRSGNDTTLRGAELTGGQVTLDVGNNLTVETRQDTTVFESEQTSSGFGISICVPPFCVGTSSASVNHSEQSIKHNYQSARGQSGINAGDQGFDITVGQHAELIRSTFLSLN